jgi:hypothetical protein
MLAYLEQPLLLQQINIFSGMHAPFIPNSDQLSFFQEHFSQYAHLLPSALEIFQAQQALKTPVKIKSLADCPVSLDFQNAGTLAVGGAPALLTAASIVKQDNQITYMIGEKIPIAYGSAFHIEEDAETEMPTNYRPTTFLAQQAVRASVGYRSLASIEKNGFFPWRTLDWAGWAKHPKEWITGIKVALPFQLATMASPEQRQEMLKKLAAQCNENEKFYDALNEELNGNLLMPGKGSIIVARNEEEVADLKTLKKNLEKEGKILDLLSEEEMIKRYGFAPKGLMYGEKKHDRVLSPQFMEILTQYIQKNGGKVIKATLTTVYADNEQTGGIAEYRTTDGQKNFIPFSRLILSLGTQLIVNANDKPMMNVVSARGVSGLLYVRVPKNYSFSPVIVCGGTNHLTKLSKPVAVQGDDGKQYDLYLMRATAGACITPNVSEKDTANYDGTIALGLITSVQKTLGDECQAEPITIYGCNRQVSQYGETRWLNPLPGIYVQYGAGGGGLTRGPDFAVRQKLEEESSYVPQLSNSRRGF